MSDFKVQARGKATVDDPWDDWGLCSWVVDRYVIEALEEDGVTKMTVTYDDGSRLQYRRKK